MSSEYYIINKSDLVTKYYTTNWDLISLVLFSFISLMTQNKHCMKKYFESETRTRDVLIPSLNLHEHRLDRNSFQSTCSEIPGMEKLKIKAIYSNLCHSDQIVVPHKYSLILEDNQIRYFMYRL